MFLILDGMGFEFYDDNEVCDMEDNFYALNFSKLHPSLSSEDSFYVSSKRGASLLRTHTTSSAIRALGGPRNEFRKFTIGKVYRNDNSSKHLPFFTQVEGIICERNLSLANVVNLVKLIICGFLKTTPYFRIRQTRFPFTEPSLEIDLCLSKSFSSSKCDYGWLEVVGLGLITRKVLKNLHSALNNVYAFGLGLERLTMLKLGINDIRTLYNKCC
ncbi:Phenylalanine--tRNA ligase alpha subunit [Candidatus Hodgkinia cicadicola]|nr:Phenylalanine--tRNA ligase alpha subunit [Candidatus Hodgkinia cicadicola]